MIDLDVDLGARHDPAVGKRGPWAGCLVALLAACSSSSSRPDGVDKAVWDDYCRQGAELASTLKESQKGVLSSSEVAARLKRAQEHISSDADAATGDVKTSMRDLADTIARAQAAAAAGRKPDFDEIAATSGLLPRC